MTLYFFERITDDDFIGPVIVAAPDEATAWSLLAARETSGVEALKTLGWQIAQDLARFPRGRRSSIRATTAGPS